MQIQVHHVAVGTAVAGLLQNILGDPVQLRTLRHDWWAVEDMAPPAVH